MTSEDIRNVTFEKSMRGYRAEDVDSFMLEVAHRLEEVETERDAAAAAKKDMEGKMYILAQKVEEYRGQEDTLKTALINAQRMGETVVKEAKQKADTLVRDATGQAELLREQAEQEILHEQMVLEKMQGEVTRFKATVLNLYKQHIESLSALDAPVARVDEYFEENQQDLPAAEEYDEEYAEEDETEEVLAVEYETEEEYQDEDLEETKPSLNLFEGIQIEND